MGTWWSAPLRAVTLEFPASNVATIDVASIIDEAYRGGVNTLCVFAVGYWPGGTTFYQSRIAPHYPGLGSRDLLAEAIAAAHRNGQKVIAYVASIWGGREMFAEHPDWAQRKPDGSPTAWDEAYTTVAMCPNSPYREYLASVVQEISENYEVDGFYFDEPSFQSWCACDHCKRKFGAETGHLLPTEARWDDVVFQEFLAWRYRQIGEWREELYHLVKRPDRCVFFQGAFPLARLIAQPIEVSGIEFTNPYQQRFGVEWHVPLAHGVDLSHSARVGDIVHFELYRRAVREPLWWYGVSLRYGQAIARGKQVLVLSMMAQSPFDLYGLPEAEIRLSIAEILANGGAPLFARYYPDRVDQEAWEIVYECLREAREVEPYLRDRKSIPYAALLFSRRTVDRFDHTGDRPSHLGALKGFAKALLQEHVLFDVLTEEDLPYRLKDYRVLVLPNTSCLSARTKRLIRDFVRGGGGVVASYQAGCYDETGQRTPEDDLSSLLGLKYVEEQPAWYGFDAYMEISRSPELKACPAGKRIPTGGVQISVEPAGAQIVAGVLRGAAVHYGPIGEELTAPAILVYGPRGRGRAVYFAPPLGNRYLEFGVEDHRRLIAAAIRWAAAAVPPVSVENAPYTMALSAFRQPDLRRTIVHLVDSVRDDLVHPITQLPKWENIVIKIQIAQEPRRVFCPGQTQEVLWSMQEGEIAVTLPQVCGSALVVIEE